jgi:ABC-type Fe3+ transport system permease subunit
MTAFPQLSNGDIDNIIAYTSEPKEAQAPAVGQTGVAATVQDDGASNNILGALVLVMAILVVMLFLVNNVLKKVAKTNGIEVAPQEARTSIWQAFIKINFNIGNGNFLIAC